MKSVGSSRRRMVCLLLIVVTILLGLVLRQVPMGLPFAVVKYGGSVLWAVMVYWIVAAVRPQWSSGEVGVVAAMSAALVEFFKLYHAPMLDSFRRTTSGKLLLGQFFSLADIAAYWIAIAVVVWVDSRLVRRG